MDLLEMVQQRRPLIPLHVGRTVDDVVPVQRRHRDEGQVRDVELRREVPELIADLGKTLLVVVDEVHLVDCQNQVRDAQQRSQEGMTPRLFQNALSGVDQHDRQIGRGGTGHHVAGVLDVPRGVGDYELPPRSREVSVGDVDGDALLSFGSKSVSEERQVRVFGAHLNRGPLDSLHLVLEDRLGVVQQPTDERGLAVINRTRCREAEHLHQK